MAGSRFDYCAFVGSSEPNVCERTYNMMRESLGPAFQGPIQDAHTYGAAMVMGLAQLQLEGAAAQRNPLDCNALLPLVEKDYKIIPEYGQSINDRQIVLAAEKARQAGALESVIEAGLTAILGSDFVNWRALELDSEVAVRVGDNRNVDWNVNDPDYAAAVFSGAINGLAYSESIATWVAVGNGICYYSGDDARTWYGGSISANNFTSVAWGSVAGVTQFVAVCPTPGGFIQSVATSANGASWAMVNAVDGVFQKVIFGGGLFVAVGTNVCMWSDDCGATWTAGTISNHTWKSVAFNGQIWVAVSLDNYRATSTDGKTFSTPSLLLGTWQDITYGNGVFVAVNSDGAATGKWSADGTSWYNITIAYPRALYAVCFGDGMFLAAASDSYLLTSKDGKTWSMLDWTSYGSHRWLTIASRPNHFYGAGLAGETFRATTFPVPKISPDYTAIKHVTLSVIAPDVAIFPGSRTLAYSSILSDGNPLMVGEYITVEPGRVGLQERIRITASTATTITATFANPHSNGVRATTAPWPTWSSTKCHSLVLVAPSVLASKTKLAKIQLFMRKIMPARCTWSVQGYTGGYTEYYYVGSRIGFASVGVVIGTDPT
jgi:hypothetical protein